MLDPSLLPWFACTKNDWRRTIFLNLTHEQQKEEELAKCTDHEAPRCVFFSHLLLRPALSVPIVSSTSVSQIQMLRMSVRYLVNLLFMTPCDWAKTRKLKLLICLSEKESAAWLNALMQHCYPWAIVGFRSATSKASDLLSSLRKP